MQNKFCPSVPEVGFSTHAFARARLSSKRLERPGPMDGQETSPNLRPAQPIPNRRVLTVDASAGRASGIRQQSRQGSGMDANLQSVGQKLQTARRRKIQVDSLPGEVSAECEKLARVHECLGTGEKDPGR